MPVPTKQVLRSGDSDDLLFPCNSGSHSFIFVRPLIHLRLHRSGDISLRQALSILTTSGFITALSIFVASGFTLSTFRNIATAGTARGLIQWMSFLMIFSISFSFSLSYDKRPNTRGDIATIREEYSKNQAFSNDAIEMYRYALFFKRFPATTNAQLVYDLERQTATRRETRRSKENGNLNISFR
jgi:hypothetical protein